MAEKWNPGKTFNKAVDTVKDTTNGAVNTVTDTVNNAGNSFVDAASDFSKAVSSGTAVAVGTLSSGAT